MISNDRTILDYVSIFKGPVFNLFLIDKKNQIDKRIKINLEDFAFYEENHKFLHLN